MGFWTFKNVGSGLEIKHMVKGKVVLAIFSHLRNGLLAAGAFAGAAKVPGVHAHVKHIRLLANFGGPYL